MTHGPAAPHQTGRADFPHTASLDVRRTARYNARCEFRRRLGFLAGDRNPHSCLAEVVPSSRGPSLQRLSSPSSVPTASSDSSSDPDTLTRGLEHPVAGATRIRRGLPCSARSCHHVPPLLPRRSASVHRLSGLPGACGLRPSDEGLGLPISFSRLRLSSLRAAARGFAARGLPTASMLVPLLLDVSQRHVGNLATLSLSDS